MNSTKENTTKVKLIAAISDNDVIGTENGELPWVLPGDLKHFKELTTNNTIVMGWNTWRSIGEKPLSNRVNIVLSRENRTLPRSKWVYQIKHPLEIFELPKHKKLGDIFIIGGGQVYDTYLPLVDEMYLTFVHINVPYEEKCVKFPKINWAEWADTDNSTRTTTYVENEIEYEFKEYVRPTLY